jgi:hypothetical protein
MKKIITILFVILTINITKSQTIDDNYWNGEEEYEYANRISRFNNNFFQFYHTPYYFQPHYYNYYTYNNFYYYRPNKWLWFGYYRSFNYYNYYSPIYYSYDYNFYPYAYNYNYYNININNYNGYNNNTNSIGKDIINRPRTNTTNSGSVNNKRSTELYKNSNNSLGPRLLNTETNKVTHIDKPTQRQTINTPRTGNIPTQRQTINTPRTGNIPSQRQTINALPQRQTNISAPSSRPINTSPSQRK